MEMNNINVLVTGADGFIGSHLAELLVKRGARVKALSLYNSFNNWGWLEDVNNIEEIQVVTGDIRDAHFCKTITKDIDIIFNLAALIAIPYSYTAPDSYVETNIKGTLNICQAALETNVGRVIQVSTSEVYATALYVPIDEKHPLSITRNLFQTIFFRLYYEIQPLSCERMFAPNCMRPAYRRACITLPHIDFPSTSLIKGNWRSQTT